MLLEENIIDIVNIILLLILLRGNAKRGVELRKVGSVVSCCVWGFILLILHGKL